MSGSYEGWTSLGPSAVLIAWWVVVSVVVLSYLRRHQDDPKEER